MIYWEIWNLLIFNWFMIQFIEKTISSNKFSKIRIKSMKKGIMKYKFLYSLVNINKSVLI